MSAATFTHAAVLEKDLEALTISARHINRQRLPYCVSTKKPHVLPTSLSGRLLASQHGAGSGTVNNPPGLTSLRTQSCTWVCVHLASIDRHKLRPFESLLRVSSGHRSGICFCTRHPALCTLHQQQQQHQQHHQRKSRHASRTSPAEVLSCRASPDVSIRAILRELQAALQCVASSVAFASLLAPAVNPVSRRLRSTTTCSRRSLRPPPL